MTPNTINVKITFFYGSVEKKKQATAAVLQKEKYIEYPNI